MNSLTNKLKELSTQKFKVYDDIYKSYLTETNDGNVKNFIQYCIDNKYLLFFTKQHLDERITIVKNNIDFTDFFKYVFDDNKTIGDKMLNEIYKNIVIHFYFKFNGKDTNIQHSESSNNFICFEIPPVTYENVDLERYITSYNQRASINKQLPNDNNQSVKTLKSIMHSTIKNHDIIQFITRFFYVQHDLQYENMCKSLLKNKQILNSISHDKDILMSLFQCTSNEIRETVFNKFNVTINNNHTQNNHCNNNQTSNENYTIDKDIESDDDSLFFNEVHSNNNQSSNNMSLIQSNLGKRSRSHSKSHSKNKKEKVIQTQSQSSIKSSKKPSIQSSTESNEEKFTKIAFRDGFSLVKQGTKQYNLHLVDYENKIFYVPKMRSWKPLKNNKPIYDGKTDFYCHRCHEICNMTVKWYKQLSKFNQCPVNNLCEKK